MKKIQLVCDSSGKVSIYPLGNILLSQENETVEFTVTYPSDLNDYYKRIDIYVDNDQSIDYKYEDVESTFIFKLGKEHLKTGYIKLQPIAYVYDELIEYVDSVKTKFEVVKFDVKYSINVSESTTNVDTTLGELLQAQIDNIDVSNKMDLDGSNSNVNVLSFDTSVSEVPLLAGQMQYNETDGTVDLGMNGGEVIQSIGLEQYYRVKNQTGSTINDGTLVMFNGTVGASGVFLIKPWDKTSSGFLIMGILTETLTNGQSGFVTWHGLIKQVQSNGVNYGETWVDGDILYPSLTYVGGMTKVENSYEPVAAVMLSHSSNGQLYARCK